MTDHTLRAQLEADLRVAMRAGDAAGRDVLRYTLAALKNAEIDQRRSLTPAEESGVLARVVKQLTEAIEQYRRGGRQDLAEREEAQLAVLKRYQPPELSDDALRRLVEDVVSETGATSQRDMAKVMPLLIERAAGQADGRRLSAAAKAALTSVTP